MTFEEHLEGHRRGDGSYDLAAAEEARAREITADPEAIDALARKAAKQERARWESNETAKLRQQFKQAALSPSLELETKVPLGDSTAVDYGDMNHERIRLRRDLREKIHREESRAYTTEMDHWDGTSALLHDGETIAEALGRS